MLTTPERPANGYDANLHIRTPSDLLPRLHAVARRRGLSTAAFVRMTLMEAVAAAEYRQAA